MRLQGLLQWALGGLPCIRGYARFGDLHSISYADPGYQRDLIQDHRDEMIQFLNNSNDLFFPEVILSCTLRYDFSRGTSDKATLDDIRAGRGFLSNIDGTQITIKAANFAIAKKDIRAPTLEQLATLVLPEPLPLENLPPKLFRIDGNHRLSASDADPKFADYIAPFCVLLFPDEQSSRQLNKVIFHNINSKDLMHNKPSRHFEHFGAKSGDKNVSDFFRDVSPVIVEANFWDILPVA